MGGEGGRRGWWVNDTQITGGCRYKREAAEEHLGAARSGLRMSRLQICSTLS